MGMPDTARRYTVDEVLAFAPDGNRYELVHGELLVTPAPTPRHQGVVTEFVVRLSNYLEAYWTVARVFVGPADIFWSDEDYVQPDVLVVPADEVTDDWHDYRTLLLAVEVVSASSARYDRVTKRRLYQQQAVATYWIVDPDARVVEVWHPGDDRPEIVTETLRWRLSPEAEELVIVLEDVFRTP
jgi:Uma2 family endonuclease